MAENKKPSLVKVKANYDRIEPLLELWGVRFLKVGEGDKAHLVAEVTEEEAKSLIDAKRAVKL
jgi:hypothetical protein